RACLELEAGQELVVTGVARVHHLQRDGAVESGVEAAVNSRRTAAGDFCLDEVAAIQQGAVQRVTAARSSHARIVSAGPGWKRCSAHLLGRSARFTLTGWAVFPPATTF